MKVKNTLVAIAGVVVLIGTTGCAMFNYTELKHTNTVAAGDRLISLKKALDAKLLSKSEYDKLRKDIIDSKKKIKVQCDGISQ